MRPREERPPGAPYDRGYARQEYIEVYEAPWFGGDPTEDTQRVLNRLRTRSGR